MSSKKTNQSDEYEPITNTQLLDETFDCLHRTARSMCQTLGRPKDRVLCRQTLHDLTMFNRSECTQIKHYVHTYLRFYLKALRWTQVNQPMLVYKKWVSDEGKWRKSNPRYMYTIYSLAMHATTHPRIHLHQMKSMSGLRMVNRIWPWNTLMTARPWSIRRSRMIPRLVGWTVAWKNW